MRYIELNKTTYYLRHERQYYQRKKDVYMKEKVKGTEIHIEIRMAWNKNLNSQCNKRKKKMNGISNLRIPGKQ